jgi:hypothetical protein
MSCFIDLSNQKFGKLTAIRRVKHKSKETGAWWLCLCDCGKNKVVYGNYLRRKHTTSCGCEKKNILRFPKYNLANRKFKHLTAIRPVGHYLGCILWECKCDCGNTINVASTNLNIGRIEDCGCRHKNKFSKNWTGYGEISSQRWTRIKNCAKIRNLEFKIGIRYTWSLFIKQNRKCALTGIPLVFSLVAHDYKNCTASLDRIDSTKGYIKGNVQWIHKSLQKIKWANSEEDLFKWVRLIYQYKNLGDTTNVQKS